ncbi:MAG: signal peptidase I [bacterium]|nr:signal peptidase I [bacterium]
MVKKEHILKESDGYIKKIYHFIFYDDSALSWIVNIILAFLLVKFIIYPGLALLLGSSLPLVAVISGSMEHEGLNFDNWWEANGAWYEEQGITKEMFEEYRFKNGFDKGDVIVLVGAEKIVQGDVVVYASASHAYPIIHRVANFNEDSYIIKGDNNDESDPYAVADEQLIGKALYRVVKIGWIKIWFAQLLSLIGF